MTNNNRPQDYGRDDKKAPQQQQQGNPGRQPGLPDKGNERDPSRNPHGSPEAQQGGHQNPGQQQAENSQPGRKEMDRKDQDCQGLNRENDPQDAQRRSGVR